MKRKIPRPFAFPFGKGKIIDEVSIESTYHEPTLQLLEFEDGTKSIRFCYYSGTRFGRSPLLIDVADWKKLKQKAQKSKVFRKFLH